jgi:hypothetical protein
MAVSIRRDPRWSPLFAPTIIAALASAVALVAMVVTKRAPGTEPWTYTGLLQRAHIFAWLAWIVLAARRLARA